MTAWKPVLDNLNLVAEPVAEALRAFTSQHPEEAKQILDAEIDPEHADTEAMTSLWGTDLFDSVNCVVVSGKRSGVEKVAACCIRATTRADVNHAVKKKLDVRTCSFMPMDEAVERTDMAHGGITPIGLGQWPIWLDTRVLGATAIIGSGLRSSKINLPGSVLALFPNTEVVEGLAVEA